MLSGGSASRRKPLTDEMKRILRAVSEDRLLSNWCGRYVISGEDARPDRKSREALVKRGYLKHRFSTTPGENRPYVLTDLAREALR